MNDYKISSIESKMKNEEREALWSKEEIEEKIQALSSVIQSENK